MPGDDEFSLIARYFAPLASGAPGAFGLTDDAALLPCHQGEAVVVTTDCMVAGVHFRADDPADRIAQKLLRVNLSDLAAMGARPAAYTLAAALPRDVSPSWLTAFAAGLKEDQARFAVSLIGGDTVATPGAMTLTVAAYGYAAADRVLRRAGATVGDRVFVSGTIGDSALGLALLQGRLSAPAEAQRQFLVDRYQLPEPRVSLGPALCGIASAAIDVSDGLVADLGHLAARSGVAIEIEIEAIPLSAAARALVTGHQPLRDTLLTAGDDYELAFTAPADVTKEVLAQGVALGVPITPVGRVGSGAGVVVHDRDGHDLDLGDGGYRHFR